MEFYAHTPQHQLLAKLAHDIAPTHDQLRELLEGVGRLTGTDPQAIYRWLSSGDCRISQGACNSVTACLAYHRAEGRLPTEGELMVQRNRMGYGEGVGPRIGLSFEDRAAPRAVRSADVASGR